MDKSQAIIDFIIQCPQIANNPLFFNAINAEDNNKGIVTIANDRILETSYVDGSVARQYSFTIIDYRSVTYDPVPKSLATSENVDEFIDVQSIVEWIEEQEDLHNYPDFGENCVVDRMTTTSALPNLSGVDENVTPALAKYIITIQIEYLDTSKQIFK